MVGEVPRSRKGTLGMSADSLREMLIGNSSSAPASAVGASKATAPPARGLPINKYPGNCVNCGARVAAEAGLREKRDDKWVVFHREGGCPEVAPAPVAAGPSAPTIEDGDYTLITEDGHRTFKVETMADDSDFAPGDTVIAFLSGSDNTSDHTRFGFVKGTAAKPRIYVWRRFKENGWESLRDDVATFATNVNRPFVLGLGAGDPDPEEDREAFRAWRDGLPVGTVLLAKRCRKCHALLTNPESIRLGIGPYCGGRA